VEPEEVIATEDAPEVVVIVNPETPEEPEPVVEPVVVVESGGDVDHEDVDRWVANEARHADHERAISELRDDMYRMVDDVRTPVVVEEEITEIPELPETEPEEPESDEDTVFPENHHPWFKPLKSWFS
jgi:hypothetical protein